MCDDGVLPISQYYPVLQKAHVLRNGFSLRESIPRLKEFWKGRAMPLTTDHYFCTISLMVDLLPCLIQSKVKRKLLKLFLFNKNKKFHTRELSRVVEEPISAVQREIKKLLELQIIVKLPEGNLVNYFVNTQSPFFEDLKAVILKTTTEPKDFFRLLINTKTIQKIYLHGETVKSPMKFSEPVKLLIVGTMDEPDVHEYITAIMEIFNRDYELIYLDPDAFEKSKLDGGQMGGILKSKSLLQLKNNDSG